MINREKIHIYIDEAGRGPLAGPLAVGLILPLQKLQKADTEPFQDSKKLTEAQREKLFEKMQEMQKKKLIVAKVSYASVEEIDTYGMTKAQNLAIERGIRELIKGLQEKIHLHLDGDRDFGLKKAHPEREIETIIKGDTKVKEISMASIMAKVSRDHWMQELPQQYQKYGFIQHKGYGTKLHYEKIKQFGPSDLHRKLFLKERFPNHKFR